MCSLCAAFMTEDGWAERGEGGATGGTGLDDDARRRARRRERARRVKLVDAVLGHRRLRLQDWDGRLYVLRDAKGRSEVVPDLAGVWTAAAALAGPLDPLDSALLDHLEAARPG